MRLEPLSDEFARDPYVAYAVLRHQDGPVWDAGLGLWLLPRHDWVAAAALDKRLVRSPDGVFAADEMEARRRAANWHDMPLHSRFVQFSLLDSDGPVHDRLRRLVFREIGPGVIARLKVETETFVAALLDTALARGTIDFVADFAAHVPGHVIGRLLGTPDEDAAMLCRWSQNIVQYFDIDRSDARKALAENTTAEFHDYLKALAAQRRRAPRDDLITRLAAAEDAGAINHDEFISTAMLVLMAGHGSSIDVMSSGWRRCCALRIRCGGCAMIRQCCRRRCRKCSASSRRCRSSIAMPPRMWNWRDAGLRKARRLDCCMARPTAIPPSSPIPTASMWRAHPTAIWPSAMARICAWAIISPA